eukprot:gene9090-10769_t
MVLAAKVDATLEVSGASLEDLDKDVQDDMVTQAASTSGVATTQITLSISSSSRRRLHQTTSPTISLAVTWYETDLSERITADGSASPDAFITTLMSNASSLFVIEGLDDMTLALKSIMAFGSAVNVATPSYPPPRPPLPPPPPACEALTPDYSPSSQQRTVVPHSGLEEYAFQVGVRLSVMDDMEAVSVMEVTIVVHPLADVVNGTAVADMSQDLLVRAELSRVERYGKSSSFAVNAAASLNGDNNGVMTLVRGISSLMVAQELPPPPPPPPPPPTSGSGVEDYTDDYDFLIDFTSGRRLTNIYRRLLDANSSWEMSARSSMLTLVAGVQTDLYTTSSSNAAVAGVAEATLENPLDLTEDTQQQALGVLTQVSSGTAVSASMAGSVCRGLNSLNLAATPAFTRRRRQLLQDSADEAPASISDSVLADEEAEAAARASEVAAVLGDLGSSMLRGAVADEAPVSTSSPTLAMKVGLARADLPDSSLYAAPIDVGDGSSSGVQFPASLGAALAGRRRRLLQDGSAVGVVSLKLLTTDSELHVGNHTSAAAGDRRRLAAATGTSTQRAGGVQQVALTGEDGEELVVESLKEAIEIVLALHPLQQAEARAKRRCMEHDGYPLPSIMQGTFLNLSLAGGEGGLPINYTFTLTARKGMRVALKTVSVAVFRGGAPVPWVVPLVCARPPCKADPTTKLTLRSSVSSDDDPLQLATVWHVFAEPTSNGFTLSDATCLTKRTNQDLVVRPGVLQVGAVYTFVLEASDRLGAASATITVATNTPPSPGSLDIQPMNGTALDTLFVITAGGWVDEDQPLRYQVHFRVFGEESERDEGDEGAYQALTPDYSPSSQQRTVDLSLAWGVGNASLVDGCEERYDTALPKSVWNGTDAGYRKWVAPVGPQGTYVADSGCPLVDNSTAGLGCRWEWTLGMFVGDGCVMAPELRCLCTHLTDFQAVENLEVDETGPPTLRGPPDLTSVSAADVLKSAVLLGVVFSLVGAGSFLAIFSSYTHHHTRRKLLEALVAEYGTGLFGFKDYRGMWTWGLFEEDRVLGVKQQSEQVQMRWRNTRAKKNEQRLEAKENELVFMIARGDIEGLERRAKLALFTQKRQAEIMQKAMVVRMVMDLELSSPYMQLVAAREKAEALEIQRAEFAFAQKWARRWRRGVLLSRLVLDIAQARTSRKQQRLDLSVLRAKERKAILQRVVLARMLYRIQLLLANPLALLLKARELGDTRAVRKAEAALAVKCLKRWKLRVKPEDALQPAPMPSGPQPPTSKLRSGAKRVAAMIQLRSLGAQQQREADSPQEDAQRVAAGTLGSHPRNMRVSRGYQQVLQEVMLAGRLSSEVSRRKSQEWRAESLAKQESKARREGRGAPSRNSARSSSDGRGDARLVRGSFEDESLSKASASPKPRASHDNSQGEDTWIQIPATHQGGLDFRASMDDSRGNQAESREDRAGRPGSRSARQSREVASRAGPREAAHMARLMAAPRPSRDGPPLKVDGRDPNDGGKMGTLDLKKIMVPAINDILHHGLTSEWGRSPRQPRTSGMAGQAGTPRAPSQSRMSRVSFSSQNQDHRETDSPQEDLQQLLRAPGLSSDCFANVDNVGTPGRTSALRQLGSKPASGHGSRRMPAEIQLPRHRFDEDMSPAPPERCALGGAAHNIAMSPPRKEGEESALPPIVEGGNATDPSMAAAPFDRTAPSHRIDSAVRASTDSLQNGAHASPRGLMGTAGPVIESSGTAASASDGQASDAAEPFTSLRHAYAAIMRDKEREQTAQAASQQKRKRKQLAEAGRRTNPLTFYTSYKERAETRKRLDQAVEERRAAVEADAAAAESMSTFQKYRLRTLEHEFNKKRCEASKSSDVLEKYRSRQAEESSQAAESDSCSNAADADINICPPEPVNASLSLQAAPEGLPEAQPHLEGGAQDQAADGAPQIEAWWSSAGIIEGGILADDSGGRRCMLDSREDPPHASATPAAAASLYAVARGSRGESAGPLGKRRGLETLSKDEGDGQEKDKWQFVAERVGATDDGGWIGWGSRPTTSGAFSWWRGASRPGTGGSALGRPGTRGSALSGRVSIDWSVYNDDDEYLLFKNGEVNPLANQHLVDIGLKAASLSADSLAVSPPVDLGNQVLLQALTEFSTNHVAQESHDEGPNMPSKVAKLGYDDRFLPTPRPLNAHMGPVQTPDESARRPMSLAAQTRKARAFHAQGDTEAEAALEAEAEAEARGRDEEAKEILGLRRAATPPEERDGPKKSGGSQWKSAVNSIRLVSSLQTDLREQKAAMDQLKLEAPPEGADEGVKDEPEGISSIMPAYREYKERQAYINRDKRHIDLALRHARDFGKVGEFVLRKYIELKKVGIRLRTDPSLGRAYRRMHNVLGLDPFGTRRPGHITDIVGHHIRDPAAARQRLRIMVVRIRCVTRFIEIWRKFQDRRSSHRMCELLGSNFTVISLSIPVDTLREMALLRKTGVQHGIQRLWSKAVIAAKSQAVMSHDRKLDDIRRVFGKAMGRPCRDLHASKEEIADEALSLERLLGTCMLLAHISVGHLTHRSQIKEQLERAERVIALAPFCPPEPVAGYT